MKKKNRAFDIKQELMYTDNAGYYDLIYSFKDYKKEVEKIIQLINQYKKSDGKDLLDVGCGSGKHLQYLTSQFSCSGADSNKGILEIAKKRCPNVNFFQADMVNMNLGKRFDVIICLFSAIGYVKTYENLQNTLQCFAKHLKPGGLVIIEPWFSKTSFHRGLASMTTYDGTDLKIARLNTSRVVNGISILDMHFTVAESGKDVKYFIDRHELGLFEVDKTLEMMKNAGLNIWHLENGISERGIFIGSKA